MMRVLRKHRQWLMIVIAILAIPFVFYFVQKPDYGAMGRGQVAQMYGRSISIDEVRHNARLFDLARALGQMDFLIDLTRGVTNPTDANEIYRQFALNLIVLRHEANRLGIHPSQDEIVKAIANFQAFRGPNGFDQHRYDEVSQNFLAPNGLSESDLQDVAQDELSVKRIKQLVSVGVTIPEAESKANYEQFYGKNVVSVVRVRANDFTKEVNVSDDDIKKYYEVHKSELKTPEQRKVEFVKLGLTDEQKKLSGRERIDALQKLADRANDFTQALLEKGADFKQVAAKFKVPVQTTGDFTGDKPDPQLAIDPSLSEAAFKLSQQDPNSDPVQVQDGFYILHLANITAPRQLALDEAKTKMVDAIKASRSREMAMNKGSQLSQSLKAALKSGTPFAAAVGQAKVKAEKIEPFNLADQIDPTRAEKPKNEPAEMSTIENLSAQLQPGEVSEFVPSADGGLIVYLEKRELPDPAKYQETKAKFEDRDLRNKQDVVFFEWLHDRQREAGLLTAKG